MVGEKHIAVLLEDGRVCRMSYSEELPPQQPTTSVPAAPTTPSASVSKEKR